MVKPNYKHTSSSRKPLLSSNARAIGYAKRHARKAETLNTLSSDVYEYKPEAIRRAKVTLSLGREEAKEYGIDMDEGNDEELRARLIGENEEDELINSGDDEDIDSDGAFDESDDDRFAGFFSSKKVTKQKTSVRLPEVDLNEKVENHDAAISYSSDEDDDEEEEEGGDDDEFIDILDILDGKGKEYDGDGVGGSIEPALKFSPTLQRQEVDDHDDEDEVSDHDDNDSQQASAAEEDIAIFLSEGEDYPPEALDELQSFISTLDPTTKKRKAPEDDSLERNNTKLDQKLPKRHRLTLRERTEAGAENEYRAQGPGTKLNIDDLLAPLASQSNVLQSFKKSTKALLPSSNSKIQTLSAPLPQRAQERLDREAAYERTKEEVDKWSGTMKRIREAEHLSFPLQVQTEGRVSNLELAAKFKPTTPLETSIDALLKSAKLREQDLPHTEDAMLAANQLSVEEVQQRRAELRKMRELMFRAEIKARRVAKIKSKTYRKIKRKEQDRLAEDDVGGHGRGEEDGGRKEVERARERATLRHKHTGAWAKRMRGREGHDEEGGRREIEEMLERGEKLRRRIRGVGSEESEENEDDGDDDSDDEGGIEKIKQDMFDELKQLDSENGSGDVEGLKEGKAIFEMKFMKDAMARQQQVTNKLVDDFVKEVGGDLGELNSYEEGVATQEVDPESGVVTQRTGGRVKYHPGGAATKQLVRVRPNSSLASDTSSVTLKSTDLLSPPSSPLHERPRPFVPLPEANPWLTSHDPDTTTVGMKAPRETNRVVVGKESSVMSKSKNKLKKLSRKQEEEKKKTYDAAVEISTNNVLTLAGDFSAKSAQEKSPSGQPETSVVTTIGVPSLRDDGDMDSEIEEQEKVINSTGKGRRNVARPFEQRDLVALAFAGDNVVHEFQETKKREVAGDAPKLVNTTLPGWGSWGGTGISKAPPKPQRLKKIAGIDPTKRSDYGLAHVIISEKRDKKAAKYQVKDLPFPYTSRAQFECTMETPLGKEWNTRVAFQRGTLPRVVKKPGMIINPLEKLP